MGWGAAIAGAASLVGGSIGGAKSTTRRRLNRRRGRLQVRNVQNRITDVFGGMQRRVEKGGKALLAGHDAGLKETENLGQNRARNVNERADAARSRVEQNATSRGMSGVSTRSNALRGVEESRTRQLADSDAAFAQMRAGQQTARGRAEYGVAGDIAQLYGMQWQSEERNVYDRLYQLFGPGAGGYIPQALDLSGIGDFIDQSVVPLFQNDKGDNEGK